MIPNTTVSIVPGSLGALSATNNLSIAESFIGVDAVLIVDVSSSMSLHDARGGKSRYEVVLEELGMLQRRNPGKLGIIAFSDLTLFIPHGQPPLLGGGTDLAGALRFARVADVDGMRFIVISDGEPNNETAALQEAALYRGRIDVIYVGPEDDPTGRRFLARLANASGGTIVTADRVYMLADKTQLLLAGRSLNG